MKAKSSLVQNRSRDRRAEPLTRRKHGPVFTLTREQVFRKCWETKHRLICAGEVLAMRDLLELRGWSILELARRSRVSRQMISAFLNLERFPTSEVVDQMASPFGLELFEFDMLACFEARGEVPLWWHRR